MGVGVEGIQNHEVVLAGGALHVPPAVLDEDRQVGREVEVSPGDGQNGRIDLHDLGRDATPEMEITGRAPRAEADEECPHRLWPGGGQIPEVGDVRGEKPEALPIDHAIVDPVDEEDPEVSRVNDLEFPVEGVAEVEDVRGTDGRRGEQEAGEDSQGARPGGGERAPNEKESAAAKHEQNDGNADQQAPHREGGNEDESGRDRPHHAAQRGHAVDASHPAAEDGELAGDDTDGQRSRHAQQYQRQSKEPGGADQRAHLQPQRRGPAEHARRHHLPDACKHRITSAARVLTRGQRSAA